MSELTPQVPPGPMTIDVALKRTIKKIGKERTETISAKDLHSFLGSQKRYVDWIERKIERYGFEDGIDYTVFHQKVKNLQGGRPRKEYAVTTDMAKELAMLDKSDMGRQVRRYFIACEQELRKFKGFSTDYVSIQKQLRSGIRAARQLGYSNGEDIERAVTEIKTETGVDLSVIFPEMEQKLYIKNKTLSAAKIANIAGITSAKVKWALDSCSVIKRDYSGAWVPGFNSDGHVAFFNERSGEMYFTPNTGILAEYISLGGNPSKWDFKNCSPILPFPWVEKSSLVASFIDEYMAPDSPETPMSIH